MKESYSFTLYNLHMTISGRETIVKYFISLDLEHFCLMSDYFSLIIFSTMNDLGGHECQLFLGHFVFQLKNAFVLN